APKSSATSSAFEASATLSSRGGESSILLVSFLAALFALIGAEIDRARRHDRGDGVLVDHLRHRVLQQHHVLIERFNLALQFDAIDHVDRNGNVLLAQSIEERVL